MAVTRHRSLYSARLIQSIPSKLTPLRSNLISNYSVVSSLQALQPKFCTHFPQPPAYYMPHPSHPPWFDHLSNIFGNNHVNIFNDIWYYRSAPKFLQFHDKTTNNQHEMMWNMQGPEPTACRLMWKVSGKWGHKHKFQNTRSAFSFLWIRGSITRWWKYGVQVFIHRQICSPDDGGSKDLWNAGKHLSDRRALQPTNSRLRRHYESLHKVWAATNCSIPSENVRAETTTMQFLPKITQFSEPAGVIAYESENIKLLAV
jgi:hypothetical protein